MLHSFPELNVLSVDVNDIYHGSRSQNVHREKMKSLVPTHRNRAVLCEGKLSLDAIASTYSLHRQLDYQVALSIFHWLPLTSLSQFNKVLRQFLMGARTTFIELPDPGHRSSANYKAWSRWYVPEVSVESRIRKALDEGRDILYTIETLGNATIDYGMRSPITTTRTVFRVDVFPANYIRHTSQTFHWLPRSIPCNHRV